MLGMTPLEVSLCLALVVMIGGCGLLLSLISERRLRLRDERRRARVRVRTEARRAAGHSVRGPVYGPDDDPGPPGRHGRPPG